MVENNKIQSLKKSSDFLFLSKNGKKIRPTKWLTIQYLDIDSKDIFFGITASRKVGSAVFRNKLKRWVRHSVRSIKFSPQSKGKKIVFVFRPQADGFYEKLSFADFKSALSELKGL